MTDAPPTKRIAGTARRQQILDVARAEFVQSGYSGARIQEIAAAVGVTDAMIYKHFASKEELFQEAVIGPINQVMDDQLEHLMALPVETEGELHLEAMRVFIRALLSAIVDSIEPMSVVLFGDRTISSQFYAERVRPVIEAAIVAVKANLSRWPSRDFDPEIATEAMFGMALGIAIDRSLTKRHLDLDRYADELSNLLFYGAAARP